MYLPEGGVLLKRVLGTFAASLVLIWGFLLFGGGMLLQNTWGALVLCALVVTVLAQLFEGQADPGWKNWRNGLPRWNRQLKDKEEP